MENCLFCKIAEKKISAKIVYEDEQAVAFEDINPQAPVHLLIIPKKHIATTLDIEPNDTRLIGHLYRVAATLAKERRIDQRGFRLVANTNAESGQTVFHLHIHLIGGRIMRWPPG
jgi:histidine triad (HIT) family protein